MTVSKISSVSLPKLDLSNNLLLFPHPMNARHNNICLLKVDWLEWSDLPQVHLQKHNEYDVCKSFRMVVFTDLPSTLISNTVGSKHISFKIIIMSMPYMQQVHVMIIPWSRTRMAASNIFRCIHLNLLS